MIPIRMTLWSHMALMSVPCLAAAGSAVAVARTATTSACARNDPACIVPTAAARNVFPAPAPRAGIARHHAPCLPRRPFRITLVS